MARRCAVLPPNKLLTKWRLLQAIMADRDLDSASKLVAARLLDHCNTNTGRCDPSYQTIAEALDYSRRHVIRCVQSLAASGWIRVRHRGQGRQAQSNQFVFSWERVESGEAQATSGTKKEAGAHYRTAIFPEREPVGVVPSTSSTSDDGFTRPDAKGDTSPANVVTTAVTSKSPETGNSNQEESNKESKQAPAKPPPSNAAVLFGDCRCYLEGAAGLSPDQSRRLLGKWRQKHQDSAIIEAVTRAKRNEAQDPVAFITACLSRSSPSHSLGAMSAIAAIERY